MATIHDIERRFPDVWLTRAAKHLERDMDANAVAAIHLLHDCKRQVPRLDLGVAFFRREPSR